MIIMNTYQVMELLPKKQMNLKIILLVK